MVQRRLPSRPLVSLLTVVHPLVFRRRGRHALHPRRGTNAALSMPLDDWHTSGELPFLSYSILITKSAFSPACRHVAAQPKLTPGPFGVVSVATTASLDRTSSTNSFSRSPADHM